MVLVFFRNPQNEVDPRVSYKLDRMAEYNNFTNVTDDSFGVEFDYRDVPTTHLAIGIVLLLLGIPLQCFVVVYERFNMDPMKRGLVNQVRALKL